MSEDEIRAAIARGQAEAVRMLDEWVRADGKREQRLAHWGEAPFACVLRDVDDMGERWRAFTGDSPEAARANAAEAIRGEL